MILQPILEFLKQAQAPVWGDRFIFVMLLAFVLALLAIWSDKHPRYQQFAPNLLTTLGILGTFVGISIGLANFDPDPKKMDESIRLLLDGLKTAFLTSVVGIGLSIITRSISTWVDSGNQDEPQQVTSVDIYQALTGIRNGVGVTNDTLEKTRLSIAGEGDASVVTQIQKTRAQMQDAADDSRKAMVGLREDLDLIGDMVAEEFRKFAEKVSEIGSKQLVQALQDVIRDFNEKLTEQFGENFKRLDESVKRLVDWQDNYKEQLQQMDEQFKAAVKGLLISRDAIGKVAEHAEAIPQHMQALSDVVRTAQVQLDDLNRHLEAFAQVRDRAVEAFPEIQKHVDDVMEQMQASVKKAADHYAIMLDDSGELIKQFKDSRNELHQQFINEVGTAITGARTALEGVTTQLEQGGQRMQGAIENAAASAEGAFGKAENAIETITTRMGNSIDEGFREQNQRIQSLTGSLREAVQDAAKDQTDLIQKLARETDDALQKELQQVMNVMGNRLSSITGKFAEDYSELTTNMQRVIEQNRRLDS